MRGNRRRGTTVALLLASAMVLAGALSGAWLIVVAGVLLAVVYVLDARRRRD